jgi:hypothetical protein
VAAGLSLTADGHFQYGLSYGALDEEAEGTWYFDGTHVVLDSKAVKAPHFSFLGQARADNGILHVDLQIPAGMDPQYFDVAVTLADGRTAGGQLSAEGLSLPLKSDEVPKSVRIVLPMFEIASDPVAVDPSKGLKLSFRFEPNDLGHVSFQGTQLESKSGELLLILHGVEIHFRHIGN